MQRRRRLLFVALGVVVLAVGLAGASVATSGRSKVARSVTLAGKNIAGLKRPALKDRVEALDRDLRKSTLKVDAPKGGFSVTLEELGVSVDIEKTIDGALEVGRTGNPISRMFGALKALVGKRSAPIEISIDEGTLRSAVTEHDPGPKKLSKEPSLALKSDVFVVVDGEAGSGINPREVMEKLPAAVRGGKPMKMDVKRGRVTPQYSAVDAEALAREANKLDELTLKVSAGGTTKTIDPDMLNTWIDALPTPEALLLGVSGLRAEKDLAKMFAGVGKPVTETRFGVSEGNVVVTPGVPGTECCDPNQVETLLTAAIRKPPTKAIPLPLKVTEPSITEDEIAEYGITKQVATFTTNHPAGQPRVKNIHRIADLVRGTVIKPHSRLSINNLVGKRTLANGFVVDHVIEDGKFSEAVGGGISQFATTLFNASWLAGLDFAEYQSHSIYISRYPYGREATLNFPHPDLIVVNNTPYGVLVWPTYTNTSLTVTLYSTKYAPGVQTNQTSKPVGTCTQVITERTRTYPDGTKKVDRTRATYRKQEGLNCDGSGTPVTTTTAPPKTTTTKPPAATTTTSPSPTTDTTL